MNCGSLLNPKFIKDYALGVGDQFIFNGLNIDVHGTVV
jgi:hypothetical protein